MISRGAIRPRLDERRQRQNCRRWVAAGIGHQIGIANRFAKQLGQAVHRFAQPIGVDVFLSVPVGVGLGTVEAIIGAQVDNPHAGVEQLGNQGRGHAVRQATECHVGPGGDLAGLQVAHAQIEPTGQLRVDASHVRIVFATAGERGDFHLRMPEQDLHQLECRVTGGADNGNANHASKRARNRKRDATVYRNRRQFATAQSLAPRPSDT